MSVNECLHENHLLTRMTGQMCSAILAAEASEGFALPVEMADQMRQKFVVGTGRPAQMGEARQKGHDGQSAAEHQCSPEKWSAENMSTVNLTHLNSSGSPNPVRGDSRLAPDAKRL